MWTFLLAAVGWSVGKFSYTALPTYKCDIWVPLLGLFHQPPLIASEVVLIIFIVHVWRLCSILKKITVQWKVTSTAWHERTLLNQWWIKCLSRNNPWPRYNTCSLPSQLECQKHVMLTVMTSALLSEICCSVNSYNELDRKQFCFTTIHDQ